jgi:hypothetical protein
MSAGDGEDTTAAVSNEKSKPVLQETEERDRFGYWI